MFSCTRRTFLQNSALTGASLLLPGLLGGCAVTRSTAVKTLPPDLQSWPLERKIAQMLLLGFPGETLEPDSPIDQAIRRYGAGGVVLFDNNIDLGVTGRNITAPAQLKQLTTALQQASELPLLIAVDQEGGVVARLKDRYGFPATVSAKYLGQQNRLDLTRSSSENLAATLDEYGFNLNLAPVVDLATNPDNPVIAFKERSFSADPALVAAHAAEFIKSHHRHHILTCLKHFPGHGSSRDDSHLGLVDVTRYWHENELQPYRDLISQGLCDMVMTAHTFNTAIDPDHPATLSRATIDGILRKQLGFDGVVVSDDLYMGAIIQHYSYETAVEKAINAGVDLLVVANDKLYSPDIMPRTIELLLNLVQQGRIPRERIEQASRRIIAMKQRLLKPGNTA
ncbi:glycoside hydrolase family 3 protein [Trichlorobacter lovleyi]|jgi:Beta-glucosidase-related glycosidases|uniref:Glycoside hydrolase family 3 domain protein n=1 Tax=Trichlorobacter lovleyi (strain ATCC BAA-1151 / DSM 17278 / SZ) TaxID=398767 RepID=B3E4C8_TRIL1|nr:glycoside hydrolase family 3 protein [Trichlorobacter lovleyi]ACD94443.1 glycoside hydrolase family 3 domain protein [Trichlorobacter lovleyi SZ]